MVARAIFGNPEFAPGEFIFEGSLVVVAVDCLPIIGQSWLANCPEQHYTLGWICCDAAPPVVEVPDTTGGGESKKRGKFRLPGISRNLEIAMQEDEELIVLIQALVARNKLH